MRVIRSMGMKMGPLPISTENAYNLIYRAFTPSVWTGLVGGVPANVNSALDLLANRVAAPAGGDLTGTYPNPQIATGVITNADVSANANIAGSKVAAASTTARGTVELATSMETTAGLAVQASDTRLTNSRPASGTAGGDLTGTYPNPTITTNAVTSAKIADGTITDQDISPTANISASKINEVDPQVGVIAPNSVPRWNSATTQLVTGSIYNDPAGNVGIGTVGPNAKLHIFDSASAYAAKDILIGSTISGYPDDVAKIQVQRYSSLGQGWNFIVNTDGAGTQTDAMRINSEGNVGIGTTLPTYKLDVNGNAIIRNSLYLSGGDRRIQADWTGDGYPHFLALVAYPPTISEMCSVLVPPQGGFVVANWENNRPNMWSHGVSGNLSIAGKYISASDDRIKLNEQNLDYGLDQVMALEPKRYDRAEWEVDPETEEIIIHPEETRNEIGLVAQDVQRIIPEAVSIPEDENRALWSISYETIIPVLVKAIQEQQEQIKELKNEIQAMKSGT